MVSCAWSSIDSPDHAPRPSYHSYDEPTGTAFAPRRLARKPSKLQTTMEVTRCRIGSRSRQAAPIGCEDLIPQKGWTPIFHAVYYEREAALQHFLQAGVSPDIMEGSGVSLLCIAAACGHFEITDILLKAGANVDLLSNDKGEAAIHVAIRTGHHDIVDLLLVHRVNLETRTASTGQTALHYAAVGPYSLAMVSKLLKFGAKYDVKDMQGRTPAVVALHAHNLQAAVAIVNMARGKRKQLIKEKSMLIQHVERSKDRNSVTNDLIANVFTATCDPDSTVLIEAIKKNDSILVQMFLEEGMDPQQATSSGLLPLIVAVKFADLRIIKFLIQYGADVTARGPGNLDVLQVFFKTFTSRDEASIVTIVEYLLAKGVDGMALYPDGKTLLHRAVGTRSDHSKTVTLLIRSGVGLDTPDNDGNTALHLAASNGLVNTTTVLLNYNANATAVDSQNRTALLRAIESQQWLVVPLLAIPPAMTSWDAEGSTALHHVAKSRPKSNCSWMDIVTAMIPFCERGVCRSMRDRSGATPLIQAIKSLPENGLPIVESLLIEGDSKWNCIGHEDHKGQDALYYAATLGKIVFVQALLEQCAPFVLKDWTEGQKHAKLPEPSKHRILEMLVKSDRSRDVATIKEHADEVPRKHIEIIRSDLRTSSALSGYHADCESERKTSANRSVSKKVSSMRHLQLSIQQRRTTAPSTAFPAHNSSIQQRSREPAVHYYTPDQDTHVRIPFSSALYQGVSPSSKSVHFTQYVDQAADATGRSSLEKTSEKPSPAFPPRNSSRRQITALSTAATFDLNTTMYPERSVSLGNESAAVVIPSAKYSQVLDLLAPTVKESQAPTQSCLKPIASAAQPTSVITMERPQTANSEHYVEGNTLPLEKTATPITTLPQLALPEKVSASASTLPERARNVQPIRADSGVILPPNDGTTKAAFVSGSPRSAVRSNIVKEKRQSGDELASWLAISSMLDRL
ncbi:hypothetical protein SVAN01_03569 [Stagonosporopsis vannaccii]|nr:hypothetical protein SVAN01_03569 [Stagonosporopsis vannaccii]